MTEIFIAKIKKSKCSFDTSVPALKELKAANVPETIIRAMMDAGQPKAQNRRAMGIPVQQQPTRQPQPQQPEFVPIEDIANGKYKIGKKQ